ncbi:MAG: hypothetical protein CML51_07240 [Rhodobacteraceae bacterium]|nr:hypothetical protein [Paracoccaceae bacterium]|tara:strand:- start:475 stop:807 length:333 start_codon:yes stop_codon:yes gene_type:complete
MGYRLWIWRSFSPIYAPRQRLYLFDDKSVFHTFAHPIASSLALLALVLHHPTCWRNFVAALLERGAQSRQASFLSSVCICAMIIFAVCVPIWIIAAVVTHDKGATLNAVL